jgi:AcrR family transcriptional regulator
VSETPAVGLPLKRLPPGRHGLPRELVRESQKQRLIAAAGDSLAEHGYARVTTTEIAKRAGVSTSTFYKRFDDLWACLLAAYEVATERLCGQIEATCLAAGPDRRQRAEAGIASALALLAAEPGLAHLLSAEPPSQAAALWSARLRLTARLAILLHNSREFGGSADREARLIGGAMSLVSMRARIRGADRLEDLAPALNQILLSP